MRLKCPLCGDRDRREFYYYGAEQYLDRPGDGAAPEAWDNYLHLRDNVAGVVRDLWSRAREPPAAIPRIARGPSRARTASKSNNPNRGSSARIEIVRNWLTIRANRFRLPVKRADGWAQMDRRLPSDALIEFANPTSE